MAVLLSTFQYTLLIKTTHSCGCFFFLLLDFLSTYVWFTKALWNRASCFESSLDVLSCLWNRVLGIGQPEEVEIPLNLHCHLLNCGDNLTMVDAMPVVETSFSQRQLVLDTERQRSQTSLGLGWGQLANSCILVSQLSESCKCCKKIWSNSAGIND